MIKGLLLTSLLIPLTVITENPSFRRVVDDEFFTDAECIKQADLITGNTRGSCSWGNSYKECISK